jgi:hypothetical protein
MRTALLGLNLRRLHFGPGPRMLLRTTSRQEVDHRSLSTNLFNNSNHSPTTGMAQASGRRSPSCLTLIVSLAQGKHSSPASQQSQEQSTPPMTSAATQMDTSMYASASYVQNQRYYPSSNHQQPEAFQSGSSIPLPRHTYTRTLVGPLCANASKLSDEHRKSGIFFLFQDLSIRTEGTIQFLRSNAVRETRAYQRVRSRGLLPPDSADERGRVSSGHMLTDSSEMGLLRRQS